MGDCVNSLATRQLIDATVQPWQGKGADIPRSPRTPPQAKADGGKFT
uniref:Uncharacterized protein n=1 Tax=Erwinia amylovora ATCC BAA-2158 TaxID=889211 RepID=E5B618_ERWAM|nr:hypothetical protein predicted by Glimmer/Critica [Erwinia amylovora ATCC BAA-2158]